MQSGMSVYFRGSVVYQGRAIGYLNVGNYLLLLKNDGSVSIHGGTKIIPRNYLGINCEMSGEIKDGQKLILKKKSETITIHFDHVYHQQSLLEWSIDEVEITNTESHLVKQLISNLDAHFPDAISVEQEYRTALGLIDVLVKTSDGTIHIIEAKRRKASIADCSQLQRYAQQFDGSVKGYIASPSIGKNALLYLETLGYSWLEVTFQEVSSVATVGL